MVMERVAIHVAQRLENWYSGSKPRVQKKVQEKFSVPTSKFNLSPRTSFVEHKGFLNDLHSSMLNPLRGVKVVWAPPGYGKTTFVRETCHRFQENKDHKTILGAIVHAASETVQGHKNNLTKWLAAGMGAPVHLDLHWFRNISDLLPDSAVEHPVAVVIDQFDHLQDSPTTKSFVVSLAEDSLRSKKYVVLLMVSQASFAEQILTWNGGQKISGIGHDVLSYKWNINHYQELWDKTSEVKSYPQVNAALRDQFLAYSSIAGTPGFFLKYRPLLDKIDMDAVQLRAKKIHEEWEHGANKLKP